MRRKGGNPVYEHVLFTICFLHYQTKILLLGEELTLNHTIPTFNDLNPLPDMPILGSSNSKATKDTMSKTWTNGDTII